MRLTKKQTEIISKVREIQQEAQRTVYFMYRKSSNKIHAVIITLKENNEIGEIEDKGILCTHTVATTMENKGILQQETIGKYKKYSGEDDLYDFALCRVNPVLL